MSADWYWAALKDKKTDGPFRATCLCNLTLLHLELQSYNACALKLIYDATDWGINTRAVTTKNSELLFDFSLKTTLSLLCERITLCCFVLRNFLIIIELSWFYCILTSFFLSYSRHLLFCESYICNLFITKNLILHKVVVWVQFFLLKEVFTFHHSCPMGRD